MALNFLHFNGSKTEIELFGTNFTGPLNTELGLLIPFIKPSVKDLGVIIDSDFKFDKQLNSAVKASFYQLWL